MTKLSSETIKHKFAAKGAGRPCESCGHSEWVLLTNFATLILQDAKASGLSSYPVVVIECTHCGNMRFYGRERLEIEDDIQHV